MQETLVWCIAITDDFVIISGDSTGMTSFWDGKMGTLIDQVPAHKADVLCFCLSEDQQTVYSAGKTTQSFEWSSQHSQSTVCLRCGPCHCALHPRHIGRRTSQVDPFLTEGNPHSRRTQPGTGRTKTYIRRCRYLPEHLFIPTKVTHQIPSSSTGKCLSIFL